MLGVLKSASADEVKKAFRKLAHEHHPDKHGGSDAKFKEINEAYQVLSNPEKRKQYDQFGSNFESAGGPGGFNWQDINRGGGFGAGANFDFGDLGDLGDLFGGVFGRGGRRHTGPAQGNDVQFVTAIDFSEAVFGTEKTLRFEKRGPCSKCEGSGAEPGAKVSTCKTCGGNGQVEQMQRTILGAIRTVGVCPTCQGEGRTADKQCTKCRGRGSEPGVRELKVKIPAGIDDRQTLRLQSEGEPGERGGPPGDLLLTVQVRPDKRFIRKGQSLYTTREISLPVAALGGKVTLETLDGEVKFKVPAGTQSGAVFTLEGKGVHHLRGKSRGDLYVTVHVKTPEKLSRKEREALKGLPASKGEEVDVGWL